MRLWGVLLGTLGYSQTVKRTARSLGKERHIYSHFRLSPTHAQACVRVQARTHAHSRAIRTNAVSLSLSASQYMYMDLAMFWQIYAHIFECVYLYVWFPLHCRFIIVI